MTPAGIRVLTVFLGAATGCYLDLGGRQTDTRFAGPAAEAGTPTGASGSDDGPGTGGSARDAASEGDVGTTGADNGGGSAGDDAGSGATQPDAGLDGACDGDPSNPGCGYRVRRQLTVEGAALTERLDNFPVLVTLNPERIDYGKTLPGGHDVRFLDADGKHLLAHEVELWKPGGTSYIWVKVPRLNPYNRHNLFMAYGSPNAPPPTNTAEVFSTSYESVYHLADELSSAPIRDTCGRHSGLAASSMNASNSVPGRVGGAIAFDGVDDLISLGDLSASEWKSITIEAWVKHPTNTDGRVLCQSSGTDDDDHVVCLGIVDTTVRAGLSTSGDEGEVASYDVSRVAGADFTHLALVWDASTEMLRVLQNGLRAGAFEHTGKVVTTSQLPMVLGNVNLKDARYLNGVIDEVRISRVARSDVWLRATFLASGPDAITYGPEEAL